jgi:hypothetical protein
MTENIQALRCFVPAKDFAASRQFYAALGFEEAWCDGKLALLQLGGCSFFLQDYFVKEWAENFVLDLRVASADEFWRFLESLQLSQRIPASVRLGPPHDDAAGIRRGHFVDPSGVLWHFSQAGHLRNAPSLG